MAGTAPLASAGTVRGPQAAVQTNYTAPLAVLTTLFFMWGFLTCLNDIIIPHLKAVFELSYAKAMLIQFAFFTAYFVMSLPSGRIVSRFGYKNGIIIGLGGAAFGCLLFYPAASIRSYGLFLLALFVLASGITLLQVAANPFVAVLGKPETASSRLTLTQAFNSLGTTIAPWFGSLLILSTAAKSSAEIKQMTPEGADAYRLAEAASVQHPVRRVGGGPDPAGGGDRALQAAQHRGRHARRAGRSAAAATRAPGATATWCWARSASSSTSAARSRSAASWSTTSKSPRSAD